MAKRSTNFTGRKPMRTGHVFSLMEWVGMSGDEIRAAVDQQKTPFFVNINGEETVPAVIRDGMVHYTVGKSQFTSMYRSADIHQVSSDGETWYEINDSVLS